jgi:NADPH-dependent stearoyl-CoA 9-desaturase
MGAAMAISDIAEYAHLSGDDVVALGKELDDIRRDVEDSRGERDRVYIRRVIAFQRFLEVAGRLSIAVGKSRRGWAVGVGALGLAKIVENMELGHNIVHGQWDWMNDPEIHSSTWEMDFVSPSSQWRNSHNYRHHVYTNVLGVDDDLGYDETLRVTRDQPWRLVYLLQPVNNVVTAFTFEWGEKSANVRALLRKAGRQIGKDYVFWPALSGLRWRRTLAANVAANVVRNLWTYLTIFPGHFADGAEKFSPAVLDEETKGEWYLRQLLGTTNFDAGPVLAFLSGNLSFHIEHHLFPDLPSNRYKDIAVRVRGICATYDLPYTSRSLAAQYLLTLRTLLKLTLPDRFLTATSDDAPETASEKRFATAARPDRAEAGEGTPRHGLVSALRDPRSRRPRTVPV